MSLDIRDGIVIETGKNLSISLRDIADTLAGAPGYKMPAGLAPGLDAAVNFETSALTYGIGAHAVELEVDPPTGGVTLLNYVVVNDCGRVINPMTAEGQIHGGAVHGIGNALFEWMGYDANAQPLTTNFADYLLPCGAGGAADRRSPRRVSEHQESARREGHRRIRHGAGGARDHLRHRGRAQRIRCADRRDAGQSGSNF